MLSRRPVACIRPFLAYSRGFSILQPSVSPIIKTAEEQEVSENISSLEKSIPAIDFTKDEPVLQTLGNPQSTLSLTVPPSVPVYVKRGSLMSLFTAGKGASVDTTVTSTLNVSQPLKRLLYGRITSTYQRLLSTVPLNLIVSAYDKTGLFGLSSKAGATKTLCNIAMDGTMDWALLDPKSLHVYTGNNLFISSQKFPKTTRDKRDTGLSQFGQSGYTLITGRGYVSVVGSGSIFKLGLAENEQIYLKKASLLATTIKETREFASGDFVAEVLNNLSFQQRKDKSVEKGETLDAAKALVTSTEEHTPSYWDKVKSWMLRTKTTVNQQTEKVAKLISGNGTYIRVKGPRVLLIQTGSGFDRFVYGSSGSIDDVEKFVKKKDELETPTAKSGDNISVVTINKDGNMNYRNTDNFDAEVERIAKKGSE